MKYSVRAMLLWMTLVCGATGLSMVIWNNEQFLLLPFAGALWGAVLGAPSDWSSDCQKPNRVGLLLGTFVGFILATAFLCFVLFLLMSNPFF